MGKLREAFLHITLGLSKKLEPGMISDFKLWYDIYDMIPSGYVVYKDNNGKFLSEYYGLNVGSTIDIKLMTEDESEKMEFKTMYVTSVETTSSSDPGRFAGDVTIHFSHPWAVMKDVKPHAYEADNSTEIIKKVLRDDGRGESFEVKDDNFMKTDDPGKYPRYKGGESDQEFLVNKVLPYCAVKEQPVHLFVNEKGEFWFKTFKELFKENSKILIGPKQEDMGLKTTADQMDKVKGDNGIDNDNVYSSNGAFFKVADPFIVSQIMPNFIVENANSGTLMTGSKILENVLKKHAGENFGNYMPLDKFLSSRTGATMTKVIRNRSILDSFFLLFQSSAITDNTFRLGIDLEFTGDVAPIGSTASVVVPKVEYGDGESKPKGKYVHWASGKWIITRAEYALDKEQQFRLRTRLFLSRATFVGNTDTTSLLNLDRMYEVPE